MKPLNPPFNNQKTDSPYRFSEKLPVGLTIHCWKGTADQWTSPLSAHDEKDMVLTFIHYKGELHIARGNDPNELQPASPGLGLLSGGSQALRFQSPSPVQLSAIVLHIPENWIHVFMKDNLNF